MITTWHLLLVICVMAPIGSALESAARAKVGIGSYCLLIGINLLLGASCAWMMDAMGAIVYAHVRRKSEAVQEWSARADHAAGLIWIFFVAFLGNWSSSAILQLVH